MVPVHRVQAEARQPLQPTVGALITMDFPVRTVFTAVQPVQLMAGAEALAKGVRRIDPAKEVGDWSVDVAPADHKHVLLTGRGWGKAMAMAGEALGRWEVVEQVSSVHLVPAVRGSAATTAAAMVAVGASAAKVWIRGCVCQAQLVCQRKEWEVKGGGPPLVPEGHILALTWRRRTEEEDGGMEAPGQGVATPAAEEEGDLGLWCHLHP